MWRGRHRGEGKEAGRRKQEPPFPHWRGAVQPEADGAAGQGPAGLSSASTQQPWGPRPVSSLLGNQEGLSKTGAFKVSLFACALDAGFRDRGQQALGHAWSVWARPASLLWALETGLGFSY